MKNSKNKITNLEECRVRIERILEEHNCNVEVEHYGWTIIRDSRTNETVGIEHNNDQPVRLYNT